MVNILHQDYVLPVHDARTGATSPLVAKVRFRLGREAAVELVQRHNELKPLQPWQRHEHSTRTPVRTEEAPRWTNRNGETVKASFFPFEADCIYLDRAGGIFLWNLFGTKPCRSRSVPIQQLIDDFGLAGATRSEIDGAVPAGAGAGATP
jgi:hypothetical protein